MLSWPFVIAFNSVVAAAISVTLIFRSRRLPGCGPKSACDAVASSRWSRLGPIDVAILGGIFYIVVCIFALVRLVAANKSVEQIFGYCAPIAIGSGLWFMLLQGFVLRRFCLYCMCLHIAGIVAGIGIFLTTRVAAIPLLLGSLFVAAFILLQILYKPRLYKLVPATDFDSSSAPIFSRENLILLGGRVVIAPLEWPLVGSTGARHTIAILFDVACQECRQLYQSLLNIVREHPDELAFYAIPVPMHPDLNPRVRKTDRFHVDSGEFARITLAVWKIDPSLYRHYEIWLMARRELPSLFELRNHVSRVLGSARLTLALSNQEMDAKLQSAADIFGKLNNDQLPQILISNGALLGKLTGAEILDMVRNSTNASTDVAKGIA